MSSASFEARLVPHRSTWDVIRLTWAPLGAAALVMLIAKLLEPASEALSSVIGGVASLTLIAGIFYLPYIWSRGPTLTLADGALSIGTRSAAIAGLHPTTGEYVYFVSSRFASGTYWMPVLTLRFPAGEPIQIGCQGAGGLAQGRTRSGGRAPHYHLPAPQWDQLAALVGAPPRTH